MHSAAGGRRGIDATMGIMARHVYDAMTGMHAMAKGRQAPINKDKQPSSHMRKQGQARTRLYLLVIIIIHGCRSPKGAGRPGVQVALLNVMHACIKSLCLCVSLDVSVCLCVSLCVFVSVCLCVSLFVSVHPAVCRCASFDLACMHVFISVFLCVSVWF